jgi:hypothetical protein
MAQGLIDGIDVPRFLVEPDSEVVARVVYIVAGL